MRMSHGQRYLRYGALLLAAVVFAYLSRGLYTPGVHSPISDPDDLRAFYCAGKTTLAGRDPYLTEPIRTCEHAAAEIFALHFPARIVVPAPLPPYALGMFALLGAFPFPAASGLWFAVSLVALGFAVVATVRLSGVSPIVVAVAFALAGGLVSINEGQLGPAIAAAVCLAALGLSNGRYGAASAGLGLGMLEPHVTVAALVVALYEPRVRRATAIAIVVLAMLDVCAGGPTRTIEYLQHVLPIHSHAEIAKYSQQFSLTTTAWSFGVSAQTALVLGTLDYLAMFGLGTVVAFRLRARFDERAFLVLVPPAFVLLGGSYIHLFQMVIALPLAFVCFGKIRRHRALLTFAVLGLAIPTQFLILASPLRTTFYPPPFPDRLVASPTDARALAETTEMNVYDYGPRPALRTALVATLPKLPTWLALATLVIVCVAEAFSNETPGPVSEILPGESGVGDTTRPPRTSRRSA